MQLLLTEMGKVAGGAGLGKDQELIFQPVNFEMPITHVREGSQEVVHSSPRMLANMLPLKMPPLPTPYPSSLCIIPGDPCPNTADKV